MDVTIPDLPPGTAPISASPFESVESGTSVRYTLAQIAATITGGGAGPWLPITGGTLTGPLGIGTGPTETLDIQKDFNGNTHIRVKNSDPGLGSNTAIVLDNGTTSGYVQYQGIGNTNPGNLIINSASGTRFTLAGADKMLIDAAGFVKISNTGVYQDLSGNYHEIRSDSGNQPLVSCVNSNNASPYGMSVTFSAASPNDVTHYFGYFEDNTALRIKLLANGGLANYSANNVNLSDANVKDQITPYSKTELAALEQSFTNVIWGKFKYRDQTHDDWNHGPTAQGVERAFEKTAPELVDESELGTKPESGVKHKVIYETDLAHIAHALLANMLKSHTAALARIEALEARVGA